MKVIQIIAAACFLSRSEALASEGGWKTRPKIPELAKNPEDSSKAATEKKPWELGRFIQQSSKFISLPLTQSKEKIIVKPGDTLWSSSSKTNERQLFQFGPLDDVVMGGASSSTFDNETGEWIGSVTSANNGGFVGIRSTPLSKKLDMSGCSGFEITAEASDNMKGKRVKASTRDSTDFNGIVWTTSFDVPRFGNSVKIPFSKQIPTIFARTIPNATFDRENISAFQFTYSKFEYDGKLNPKFSLGDFGLKIQQIKAI